MCGIAGIAVFRDFPQPNHRSAEGHVRYADLTAARTTTGWISATAWPWACGVWPSLTLSGGKQPIFNEDGTIRTVFNGEIYNYRELRTALLARGHQFKTNSDTEAIVHAYEEYGPDFPKHLNGMFAIALHDSVRRRLYLVRDHIGIKPLYYCVTKHYIAWGSEIKALLAAGLAERDLDVDALAEYLAWEYIPGIRTLI